MRPLVGLQWEVFDALEDLNTYGFTAIQAMTQSMVVSPHVFDLSDVRDGVALLEFLREAKLPAVARLAKIMGGIVDSTPDRADICAVLNDLLNDRRLFDQFDGLVELSDLDRSVERPELSFLGTEKRRLPTKGLYPNGLRRFQARRVNRLLMEAIVPERLLARRHDLNENDVVDHMLDRTDVSSLRSVTIYAHPDHRSVCLAATLDGLRQRGWEGTESRIEFGGEVEWDPNHAWDGDSAQVWCRSPENWHVYQQL